MDYRISADGRVESKFARFRQHVYSWHSHPAYAFGVTEQGAQAFRCRGERRVSTAGMVMALNPDDPHDGHAAAEGGYHYRMLYVSADAIDDVLTDAAQRRVGMPLFEQPVCTDDGLASAIRQLSFALRDGDRLVYAECLMRLVLAITTRATRRSARTRASGGRMAAARARLLSDPEVGLDELATTARTSRYGLYRGFRQAFGMSPGQYRRQLRLERARQLIAKGGQLADVAVTVGFTDQAHLTRWFVRHYGITPGSYRAAAGGSFDVPTEGSVR